MITPINHNVQFDYYELNNYINNVLLYLVNKSFTININIIQMKNLVDEDKFWIRQVVISEMSPSKDIRFKITNNLINAFKKAHNDKTNYAR